MVTADDDWPLIRPLFLPRSAAPHPVLLLAEVHAELGRSCRQNGAAQERRRDELNGVRHHLVLFSQLVQLGHQLHAEHALVLLENRAANPLSFLKSSSVWTFIQLHSLNFLSIEDTFPLLPSEST